VLSLRDLIVARPEAAIADIMIKRVVAVPLDARPEDVAAVIAKYNLLAVPVVDDEDRMQGIVTIDDAMDEVMPGRRSPPGEGTVMRRRSGREDDPPSDGAAPPSCRGRRPAA